VAEKDEKGTTAPSSGDTKGTVGDQRQTPEARQTMEEAQGHGRTSDQGPHSEPIVQHAVVGGRVPDSETVQAQMAKQAKGRAEVEQTEVVKFVDADGKERFEEMKYIPGGRAGTSKSVGGKSYQFDQRNNLYRESVEAE
jgi:hypothetical protein